MALVVDPEEADIYTLIRSLVKLESGRYCRRCGASISPHDVFGVGEGVCAGCRQ